MKANEVSLNSFLSQTKTQFIIPVYQRNYDWTEHQCSQLLDDIISVGSKQGESHFIGSIVFIHEGVYTSSEVKQLVVSRDWPHLHYFILLFKNSLQRTGEKKKQMRLRKYLLLTGLSRMRQTNWNWNSRTLMPMHLNFFWGIANLQITLNSQGLLRISTSLLRT